MNEAIGLHGRLLGHAGALLCALSLACAAQSRQQAQLDDARERVKSLREYEAPENYRDQIERHLAAAIPGASLRDILIAPPSGAIVCGHVKPERARGPGAGYLPFGAIFDAAGSLRWLRVFQPFQGMYATSVADPRPTGDDLAIAIACDIPLVF